MKKIDLICIGDQKHRGLKELEKKYIQKINFFTPFFIKNVKQVKSKNEDSTKQKEGKKVLEHIGKKDFVIAFDQYGKKMDSIEFARLLSDKIFYQTDGVIFLIGGHSGLSNLLDNRIDLKISFSDMTIAHDIFRIVFLEQLYRAFTLIKKIKYHR